MRLFFQFKKKYGASTRSGKTAKNDAPIIVRACVALGSDQEAIVNPDINAIKESSKTNLKDCEVTLPNFTVSTFR